jgi:putative FmdB family regulatory protein
LPIYEYQCEKCGVVTDIKHGFKETTQEACPKCGGALKRLFNPAGIVFKGSGFYITDSRKGGESSGDSGGASGKSDSGKSDSAKGDSAKSESAPKGDSGPKSDTAA